MSATATNQRLARVYLKNGPTIKLDVPDKHAAGYGDTPDEAWVEGSRKSLELLAEEGKALKGTTHEGEPIVIPAGEYSSVVFESPNDDSREQTARDILARPSGRAAPAAIGEGHLADTITEYLGRGNIGMAISLSDRETVQSWLAEASFGGEALVRIENGDLGVIAGYNDEADGYTGKFVVDHALSGKTMDPVDITAIHWVYTTSLEDDVNALVWAVHQADPEGGAPSRQSVIHMITARPGELFER